MNEEEKQELEHLNKRYDFISQNPLATNIFTTYDAHCLGTALNLISKLQKEKEELEFKLLARERGEAELETLIDQLKEELDKSNERIDMCIDLLNLEGCLKFDTKQEKLDYIDKLIKLEVEDEKK